MVKFCKQTSIVVSNDLLLCKNRAGQTHNLYGPASIGFEERHPILRIKTVSFQINGQIRMINKGPSYFIFKDGLLEVYWDYAPAKYIAKRYYSDGSICKIHYGHSYKERYFARGEARDNVLQYYQIIVVPQIKTLFERARIVGNIIF